MEQIGAIAELIDALKKLPGVGPRAAQRIAYQLLNGDRSDANRLGEALLKATKTVHRCARCNNLTDGELCSFCASHNRDDSLLCIVESVADLMVIEQPFLSRPLLYFDGTPVPVKRRRAARNRLG
jgi:recombination protein RecR